MITAGREADRQILPRIMIDGPFGSASEDFTKFETVLLVGGELARTIGSWQRS